MFPSLRFSPARLVQHAEILDARPAGAGHLLVLLPPGTGWHGATEHVAALAVLKRNGKKADALAKSPLTLELPGGCLSVWLRLDPARDAYAWNAALRRALKPLLDEHPERLDIAVFGDEAFRHRAGEAVAYVAWVNGAHLPAWKSEKAPAPLKRIELHGVTGLDLAHACALAEGNTLCRTLTLLPPNVLTPASYRARICDLARSMVGTSKNTT